MKDLTIYNIIVELIKLELKVLVAAPKFYHRVWKGVFQGATLGYLTYVAAYLGGSKEYVEHAVSMFEEYMDAFGIDAFTKARTLQGLDQTIAAMDIAEDVVKNYGKDIYQA